MTTNEQQHSTNDWSLTFTYAPENETDTHVLLTVTDDQESIERTMFFVKSQYDKSAPTDYVLDVRDHNQDIQSYCFVTYEKMKSLADSMGYELREPAKLAVHQEK